MAAEVVRQPHKPLPTVSYSNVVSGARPNVPVGSEKKLDDNQFPTMGESQSNGGQPKSPEEARSDSPAMQNGHASRSETDSPVERRGRSRKLHSNKTSAAAKVSSGKSSPSLPNGRHHSSDDCPSDKEGKPDKFNAEPAVPVVLKPAPPPAENAWFKRKSGKTPPPPQTASNPALITPSFHPGKNSPAAHQSSPHKVTLVARDFLNQLNAAVAAAIQNSTEDVAKPSLAAHRGNIVWPLWVCNFFSLLYTSSRVVFDGNSDAHQ